MTQMYTDLLSLLNQTGNADFFKIVLKTALEKLMEADVSNQISAEPGERSPHRESYRNGYRSRELKTRVGEIELGIPKIRKGSYFPSFLNHYQRTEKALLSVVQESYIHGVSTRKMEKLSNKWELKESVNPKFLRSVRGFCVKLKRTLARL